MLSSIQIRQLTSDDYESFKEMDTGIEDDYVLRIFPHSVHQEATFGIFHYDRLVSIAAYTVFAGQYAILGRVRTDRRYRQNGLSSILLSDLCRKIDHSEKISWVGLATELNNLAMQSISKNLGFSRLSVFTSYIINEDVGALHDRAIKEWYEIDGVAEKRSLLKKVRPDENPLRIFPYECYYPLPFEETLWSDAYLNKCRFLVREDRFIILMKDTKGSSYLHAKYLFEDLFLEPGLFALLLQESKNQGLRLWVDLPYSNGLPESYKRFFETTIWTNWGRRSP